MRRLRRLLLLIGLALALAAGLLLWQQEHLLQGVLRPALVRALSVASGGEATLGRLELGWNHLSLFDLRLVKPESMVVELQRGEATWTFASLLGRRLVTLDLVGPRLTLFAPAKQDSSPLPPGTGFPFDYLRIVDGQLAIPLGGGELELRDLALELVDGAPPTLTMRGVVGAEGVPVDLSGSLAWNQGFELILEQLQWDGEQRLLAPLRLNLERDRSLHGRGVLAIETLDAPTLERWLKALGVPNPLPPGVALAVEGARLEAEITPEQVSARLQLEQGAAQGADWRLPLTELELTLGGSRRNWQGEGMAKLAGQFPLQLELRGEQGRLSAQGRLAELGGKPDAGATLQASANRDEHGEWQGEVSLDRLRQPEVAAVLQALGRPSSLAKGVDFDLVEPKLSWRQQAAGSTAAFSLASGQLQGPGWRLPLAAVALQARQADGGWRGEGSLRLAEAPVRLAADYREGVASGSATLVSTRAAELLRSLGVGNFPLAGGFELKLDGRWQDGALSGTARLRGHSQKPLPAQARLDLGAVELTARLRQQAGVVRGEGELSLAGRVLLRASGDQHQLRLSLAPSSWTELRPLLPPPARPALLQDAEGLSAEVRIAPTRAGWQARGTGKAASLRLEPGTLEGASWAATLESSGTGLRLRDTRLDGRLQTAAGSVARFELEAEAEQTPTAYRLRLQRLAAEGIELLAADGLSGLSGGHLEGKGEVSGRRAGGPVALQLALQGGVKELLAGAFYGDFSGVENELILTGEFAPQTQRLHAQRLDVRLGDLARGRLKGNLSPDAGEFGGSIDLPQLAALERQLLPALTAAYPSLAGLQPTGGLQLEGSGRWGGGGWSLQGDARPQDLGLRWPGPKLELQGLKGRLPFDLGLALAAPVATSAQGYLELDRLQAGPLSLPAGRLALRTGRNRLHFDSPLMFALAAGELRLADLDLGRGPDGFELAAQVRLGEIDLDRLTRELDLPPMQGRLSANLGTIRYGNEQLSSSGTAGINAFNGGILVKNIRLGSPFSSYRTLEADVDFSGIDLYALTRTFEFGEMNGIADGYIHGLRLFGAVPSAFDASFTTRLEGRRNISVKALKNLSILSQGGLQAALSQGIYRFIDFYRYRRIGFHCSLDNDLFRLQGTAREGSDRYLIYGGWLPPKIDIIAPGRSISFKEMVKRLGRLDRSAAGT